MLFSSVFFVFFIRFISCLPDHAEGNSTQFKILLPSPDDRFVTIFYRYGKVPEVSYSVLLYTDKPLNNLSVSAESRQPSIVTVSEQVTISSCQENTTWNVTMNNRATLPASYNADNLLSAEICQNLSFYSTSVYLGYSVIRFYASFDESDGLQYIGNITMRSMREHRLIDKVFNAVVMAAVVVATLGMGNDLDFQTIKEHLKTPKAPVIAMISQFTVMPLTSYAIIRIMGHTGARALGFFVLGCSPAGINSNMFSKLLNGDLSLSVTMTTLSTAISLGMLPLWVYTLGSTIPADEGLEKVKIPFIGNVKSFSLIIGTLAVGVFIKYKLPKVSKILRRILKVVFLAILLFFLVVAGFLTPFIFMGWTTKFVLSSILLPVGGLSFGGLLAWICRFKWKLIKTIALETAMQNVTVCVLVVQSVATQPDYDLAIVLPLITNHMTCWPMLVIAFAYLVRERILLKQKSQLKKQQTSCENQESQKSQMLEELNRDPGEKISKDEEEEQDEQREGLVIDDKL